MSKGHTFDSDYLSLALDLVHRKNTIRKAVRFLTDHIGEFDVIAFRGMSGALIAPAVADKLKKGLLLIRKPGEHSHSGYQVEGSTGDRYLILDDRVATGDTVRDIIKQLVVIHAFRGLKPPIFLGIYLYDRHDYPEFVLWDLKQSDDKQVKVLNVETKG